MSRENIWLLIFALILGLVWLGPRLFTRVPGSETGGTLTAEEQAILARMNRVLIRDAIAPIYDPQFVPAAQARLGADELVLGVEINGKAKAYSITVLNSREMVNDELDGIPILVTW